MSDYLATCQQPTLPVAVYTDTALPSTAGSWASADAAAEAARLMDDASTNMRHGAPGGPLGRGQVSEVVQAAIGLIRGQQVSARCVSAGRLLSCERVAQHILALGLKSIHAGFWGGHKFIDRTRFH